MTEDSIVRENLMTIAGYTPFCGSETCWYRMPRTKWDGNQFACKCGWSSKFPDDFIKRYKQKWGMSQTESQEKPIH